MKPSLDFVGHFWLPGRSHKQVPGTFTFTPTDGGKLSLVGSFKDTQELFANNDPYDYQRIIGHDRGDIYTLDRCLRTNESFRNGELRQSFRVGRVLKDVEYEKGEQIITDRLVIEMAYLLEWSNISGIEYEWESHEPGVTRSKNTLTSSNQPTQSTPISSGSVALAHLARTTNHGIREYCFRQDVVASFNFDTALRLEDALQFASDLQDLVAIATYKRPSFGKITMYHSGLDIEAADGRKIPQPVELFEEWVILGDEDAEVTKPVRASFGLGDFGGIDGLGRWMSAAERYREPLGRIMATRYHRNMTVQDALLGRIAALERFHQIRYSPKKRVPLVTRLMELTDDLGEDFLGLTEKSGQRENAHKWCELAKELRNEVAHQAGRVFERNTVEVHRVSQAAYWLFILSLLKVVGVPRKTFECLITSSQFRLDSAGLIGVLLADDPM